jgi:hypothetical protein
MSPFPPPHTPDQPLGRLYHFSEDGSIERFTPRPAPSNPGGLPGIRVVDAVHAPSYWFPRRCPRVFVWADNADQQRSVNQVFGTDAARLCAVESSWLDQIREATVYCYEFDPGPFVSDDMPGHYVAPQEVPVVRRGVLGDVLALMASSDVELRITPRLGPLTDLVLRSGVQFRFMNLRGARR